ncbi:temptin-like isoform X4 [Littorina saxatilis]|uniref:Temptin Cys/Cys disulfide domain-containing protein n=1 Tax=Littorina saxatilis TaxID=31220 RepID=A0AAN9BS70_9CAEN
MFSLIVVLSLVGPALGYGKYRYSIPHGHDVLSPCRWGDKSWPGVGHTNQAGGGDLNPFGQDFKAEGFKYTVSLCQKDSDGDGKTNGQELGDSSCSWAKYKRLAILDKATGHPGICEPLYSSACLGRSDWVKCSF